MITPGQPCTGCGTPMAYARGGRNSNRPAPEGMRHHKAHGVCSTCEQKITVVRSVQGRSGPCGGWMAPPDWVNVDRALTGERVALNVAERRAVIAALTERRCSAAGIARRLGMHQRSVVRVRARIRAEGRERTDAAA